MNLAHVAVAAGALLALGYWWYGRLLGKWLDLSPSRPTPAHELADGVDYVPAKAPFLLAQHFSAIAAAGPIVGPILAGLAFGWLPTLLWIVFGAIFIGALHDFSSLIGSVRHRAASIVQIAREQLGPRAHLLFLGFVWLSLIYVITAFTDLTSASFLDPAEGSLVAGASASYLALAVAMGVSLRLLRMPLWLATVIFIPLLGLIIASSASLSLTFPAVGPFSARSVCNVAILFYCLIASVLPVWLLLQPRGYLGGFFLYIVLIAGAIGLFIGGDPIRYPAFVGWTSPQGQSLFPLLFVTVACGACSGFHGIVSSGTTSRQISAESDCRLVGYGGMLLEAAVAVIALATVMLLVPGDPQTLQSPDRVYANGLSHIIGGLGINKEFARGFVLLAFATFIFDTLDVATRLGRYVFQELTGWHGPIGRVGATLITLAIPAACVSLTLQDAAGKVIPAWKVFWTVFGTSNQLLAALTLLTLTVWLKRSGRPWLISGVPAVFVLVMTVWSLGILAGQWLTQLIQGQLKVNWIAVVALILMSLTALITVEAARALKGSLPKPEA